MNTREKDQQKAFLSQLNKNEGKIKVYKSEIESAEKKIKQLKEDNSVIAKELDSLKNESYQKAKNMLQSHKDEVDSLKRQNQDLQQWLSRKQDELKSLKAARDNSVIEIKKENQNLQLRFDSYSRQIDLHQRQTEAKEKSLKISIKEKEDLILALRKEKDDLQTRLSSVAGEKLTKGNPAITDLGDPNRPMKIGEMYGELYDNEWTDAMEYTDTVQGYYPDKKKSEIEEIVIRHLHRLLICCYTHCVKVSAEQLCTIGQNVAVTLYLNLDSDEKYSSFPGSKEVIIKRRHNIENTIKFFLEKQVIGKEMVVQGWEFEHKNEKLISSLLKTTFFEKCIHLCWSMAIQDPMMQLDKDLQPGTVFDKSQYKEFVKSGDTVSFVVWPALYLHENGPLLYKGVVQAYWQ
ncbi:uncharacterized protein LOC127715482 [Mytilus californianus]|uniref:uncharacterized protein LOC127715482 n=1 Tax=Mytilus californianus TaxID=6549 RepID=UPI0022465AB1|nr:uncharacterized protein LOC127715482 [Mytilus californianus]